MTCIPFSGGGIIGYVCVNDQIRFHVGNKYIWMSWPDYTGPSFYTKHKGEEVYHDPVDETDPVWVEFDKWYTKRQLRK